MNRIASLMALAAASAGLHAQNNANVEIYGIVDGGVNHTTGIAGGSKKSVVSGIMEGSRLGFKGNEDLGGGYRALFTLEHRLELDTGSGSNRPLSGSQLPDRFASATLLGLNPALQPVVNSVAPLLGSQIGVNLSNRFWDRQLYLGLVTPVGAILAGRQYTPAYEVAAAFDTTSTQSALANGQISTFPPTVDIRVDNSLAYRIQQSGFSATLMAAAPEGSTSTGAFYAFNVIYKGPAFSAGLGYNTRENELGQKSLTTTVVGATVNAGPGTVVGAYATVKDDNPSGLSTLSSQLVAAGVSVPAASAVQSAYIRAFKQDSRIWHAGYRMTTGPHTIYVAYTHLDDKLAPDADVSSYGGAYSYALSKRTDINFVLARMDNRNLAQSAPGQAGMVGGVTASAGTDSTSVSLGIRHRF